MTRSNRWLDLALALSLVVAWGTAPALADSAQSADKFDLTLRSPENPDTWVRPTLRMDSALFFENNSWAGNSRNLIGGHSRFWGEFGVVPGVEGQLSLGEEGTLRARFSAVYTTTQFGLDAAGSNLGYNHQHPDRITLEDAYVGWKSGDLFPSLGKDAIDLSVGSQPYQAGTGFLFYDGSTDGGQRGGYWLGLRRAFRFTGIARLNTGPFLAEAMYLRPYDEPNTSTKVAGMNLEYKFGERAKLGGGYWNVFSSKDNRREGLNILDLRGEVNPLASLPGLGLSGEVVREINGSKNQSWGGYAEVGYDFGEKVTWKPYVAYRIISFSGDPGSGSNRAFDPLFYGFYDWNQWYLGEIVGEYVASNRNLTVNMLRFRVNPIPSVTTQLFYLYFRMNRFQNEVTSRPPSSERSAVIGSKDLAHELDFVVDWSANDHLSFSAVAAVLIPSTGARDFFGGSQTWSHFMLYASVKF